MKINVNLTALKNTLEQVQEACLAVAVIPFNEYELLEDRYVLHWIPLQKENRLWDKTVPSLEFNYDDDINVVVYNCIERGRIFGELFEKDSEDGYRTDLNLVNCSYENYCQNILETGTFKEDRTGVGTVSTFGRELRYDLSLGFPLITTKQVSLRQVMIELMWMLNGCDNVKWLQERGCTIWDEWARADGSLGPIYGVQWRKWPQYVEHDTTYDPEKGGSQKTEPTYVKRHIDQIADLIKTIKTNPDSRRMIVSAWNVADVPQMALPPCHAFFQFYVADGKLSCKITQRK